MTLRTARKRQLRRERSSIVTSAKSESADEVLDKEYCIITDEIKELKKKKSQGCTGMAISGAY